MSKEIVEQLREKHVAIAHDAEVEGWPERLKDHLASQYLAIIEIMERLRAIEKRSEDTEG